MAAPIAVKTWMEFESLMLHSLHYTDVKKCLSGGELNNDKLGHNKHMINGQILLGRLKVGSVGWLEISFANTSQSNLSPQHPNRIYCDNPSPQIKLFMNPSPLPIELLHLIFN